MLSEVCERWNVVLFRIHSAFLPVILLCGKHSTFVWILKHKCSWKMQAVWKSTGHGLCLNTFQRIFHLNLVQLCLLSLCLMWDLICMIEWMHFVLFFQVGSFDPYSDDPRLGIQKVCLCKYSGRLVVAGTAGQVMSSYSVCAHTCGGTVIKLNSGKLFGWTYSAKNLYLR